jgi:hypothetical protein
MQEIDTHTETRTIDPSAVSGWHSSTFQGVVGNRNLNYETESIYHFFQGPYCEFLVVGYPTTLTGMQQLAEKLNMTYAKMIGPRYITLQE